LAGTSLDCSATGFIAATCIATSLRSDVVALELDQHADARAVQVARELGTARLALEAADRHVFTDRTDQALAHVFERRAVAVLRVVGNARP
jgi:hypothetical protein